MTTEWTITSYVGWARKDLRKQMGDSTVRFKLLAAHYYDGLNGHSTVAGADLEADLLLVGHLHRTRTLQKEPYYALATATAQIYQRGALFNFKRTQAGW